MYLLRKRWGIEGGLGWRRGEYVVEKDAAVALAVAVTGTILDCRTHVNSCLVNLAVDLCSVCMGSFGLRLSGTLAVKHVRRREINPPDREFNWI